MLFLFHLKFDVFQSIFIKFVFFYGFLYLINQEKVIKIDNLINESFYQNNQDFSQYQTKYKCIAIFYPNNNSSLTNHNKEIKNIINYNKIEEKIKLAKSHGIFGFGIIYYWINYYNIHKYILNYISYVDKLNFPFFIILNENFKYQSQNNNYLIKNFENNQKSEFNYFDKIEAYLLSENYIKYKGFPIIGIFHSSKNKSSLINDFREYERENEKVKSFIISIYHERRVEEYNNLSNYSINFPQQKLGLPNNLDQQYFYNWYYYNLLNQETNITKNINNFLIVDGKNPYKFYILLNKYLNQINHNDNDSFILFNAWNNYEENSYLEPNELYGFSYLNYFSKSIFNLEEKKIYDLNKLLNYKCKIAIQIHLFYEDLIVDIINKTNNIPVKFDLYITITSFDIYHKLENQIKNHSYCNNYQILLVENKGRDVLPFITQMKTYFKKYKYICHIHSKKSETSPEIGFLWRNYLFNNLLGNTEIISEILNDFEKNKKLGFIFPETFLKIVDPFYILTYRTGYWINILSKRFFPDLKIGKLESFPAGNMFWAKIKAIFQVFIYDFSEFFPKEDEQINDTIMHGIERIWLYLVKYNHYKYKNIFKFF